MSLRISDVEELVDCTSVLEVVEELARIASEKADAEGAKFSPDSAPHATLWDNLAARLLNDALWMRDHGSLFT